VLLQDPQPYNSAAMARRIEGTLEQVISLTSHVQVRALFAHSSSDALAQSCLLLAALLHAVCGVQDSPLSEAGDRQQLLPCALC
jgi:hypothetical protein